MKNCGDIDIDCGDRDVILQHLEHTAASMRIDGNIRRHQTGVYVTNVPYDPENDMCILDYRIAEDRGYFKIDFLNVNVYKHIDSEEHLIEMMGDPDWSMLNNYDIVKNLLHIGGQWHMLREMPEPIDNIQKLAMFLAIIRPGKRHLAGKTWNEIESTVWERDSTDGYTFRKSHAIAYAQLIVVNLNLIRAGKLKLSN